MRLRDRRGQTSSEYLGGLLLVAAIVAAIAISGVADALAGHVERLVCNIAGAGCEASADSRPAEGARPGDDGTVDGPAPVPDGPLVVLPFPGSVSVKCSVSRESERTCRAPPGVAVTTGELRVDRSTTRLNGQGCPQQILSVTTTLKLESTLPVGNKRAGGSLTNYVGTSNRYSVTVAPDQADAIENGDREAPNALDPRTIRPGESVQMNKEFFDGISASAQYHAIQAQLGYEEGHRVSSGVTRVDDSTVRVYVGDEDFVRSALALGLGVGGAKVSLGRTTELTDGKLHGIDIDISSPAGWNAYQQFVTTGTLPKSGTAGTSDAARSRVTRGRGSTAMEAELGPIKVGGELSDDEMAVIETTYPNGSGEKVLVVRANDAGAEIVNPHNADGNPIAQPRRAINLEGVDLGDWQRFQTFTGGDDPLPPDGNVRIEFTPSDFSRLRQDAIDYVAWELENVHGLSRDQIDYDDITDNLGRNGGEYRFPNGQRYALDEPMASLFARSDWTPDDIVLYLAHIGSRPNDSGHVLDQLAHFSDALAISKGQDHWSPLPMDVREPDCG